MHKELSKEWLDWILENIQRGVDKKDILQILMEQKFDSTECKIILGMELEKEDILAAKELSKKAITYSGNPKIPHKNIDNVPAEIYEIKKFLTKRECDLLIAEIKKKLRPSTIASSGEYDATYRTSKTCDLGNIESKFMSDIDRKICDFIGINSTYGETLQGQHYLKGDEFKVHTDYFEEEQLKEYDKGRGQRTYTFMIYLNEDLQGGETEFPELNSIFEPKIGKALIWNNLNEDGSINRNTMHQAHPVTHGEKTIITKWFREK